MKRPMMEKAIDKFLKQDLENAKTMFEMALLEEPFNVTAKLGIVCIDAMQDGFSEALEVFKLAMFATEEEKEKIYGSLVEGAWEERNIDAEWYMDSEFLAQAYIETGDADVARAELEAAIYLDPRSAENHHLLGKTYEKLGDIERAINHYEQSLSINPLQREVSKRILKLVQKKNGKKRDS
ncbi:MAG: tetratricopeptide repeat protein [Campylobacterota bacterium]|nr:tetratricopeptide repeat protein [Campylobacterota bacterium]